MGAWAPANEFAATKSTKPGQKGGEKMQQLQQSQKQTKAVNGELGQRKGADLKRPAPGNNQMVAHLTPTCTCSNFPRIKRLHCKNGGNCNKMSMVDGLKEERVTGPYCHPVGMAL